MSHPLVDSNTLLAVETVFHHDGTVDPWAEKILPVFVDFFVYSDRFRITQPAPDPSAIAAADKSELVHQISAYDAMLVESATISTREPLQLADDALDEYFQKFHDWAYTNRALVARWLPTHFTPRVRRFHDRQIGRSYLFNLEKLERSPIFARAAQQLKIDSQHVAYTFDNVLRYPIYGALAGPDSFYLHHPLRDAFPNRQCEGGRRPAYPVHWGPAVARLTQHMSQLEFVQLLHELRNAVREERIHLRLPGEVPIEKVQDVCRRIRLPPKLKGVNTASATLAGLFTAAAVFPALEAAAAVLGALVTVAGAVWRGRLPRAAASMSWLTWVEWDEVEIPTPKDSNGLMQNDARR